MRVISYFFLFILMVLTGCKNNNNLKKINGVIGKDYLELASWIISSDYKKDLISQCGLKPSDSCVLVNALVRNAPNLNSNLKEDAEMNIREACIHGHRGSCNLVGSNSMDQFNQIFKKQKDVTFDVANQKCEKGEGAYCEMAGDKDNIWYSDDALNEAFIQANKIKTTETIDFYTRGCMLKNGSSCYKAGIFILLSQSVSCPAIIPKARKMYTKGCFLGDILSCGALAEMSVNYCINKKAQFLSNYKANQEAAILKLKGLKHYDFVLTYSLQEIKLRCQKGNEFSCFEFSNIINNSERLQSDGEISKEPLREVIALRKKTCKLGVGCRVLYHMEKSTIVDKKKGDSDDLFYLSMKYCRQGIAQACYDLAKEIESPKHNINSNELILQALYIKSCVKGDYRACIVSNPNYNAILKEIGKSFVNKNKN